MDKEQLNQQRKLLYKATPLKLKLVDELIPLVKSCFGDNIETTNIDFKEDKTITIDGLKVRSIEIDPQEIGGILIHWYSKLNVSTRKDPYCSIYILNIEEIKRIIRRIKMIHTYYLSSLNW
jgi:hypothetical protein